MLGITIPGRDELTIKNVVFDFNGTLAANGKLSESAKELIAQIRDDVSVYILSSDTYGTVLKECQGLHINVKTVSGGPEKREYVDSLGAADTICVGNGMNDVGMFETCALSIAVIGAEGCAVKALAAADIAVKNIEDAFGLILNPSRITATLRG
jgi:soluble P-type ATPase